MQNILQMLEVKNFLIMSKTNAERSKAKRDKKLSLGLKKVECWILSENEPAFKLIEVKFREKQEEQNNGN